MLHMWTTQRTQRYPEVPWLEMQYEQQIGMPSGRLSSVPGFGIQIRRVGCGLAVMLRSVTRRRRPAGARLFIPSTPAVFLAISTQPLEKVKVRGGDDSGPSTVSFCKDRRKNSRPS